MFMVKTGISMLFVKCKTRGEQLVVLMGMLMLIAVCYGVTRFSLGLGGALHEASMEAENTDLMEDAMMARMTFWGYSGAALGIVLGIVFSIVAVVNAVRFITKTGLAPDDGWS